MENTSGPQFAKWDFRSCMLLDMHPIWFQMKRERKKEKRLAFMTLISTQ